MEKVIKRRRSLNQALVRLRESLAKISVPEYIELRDELRDSIIQRFEFCADLMWKTLREYLSVQRDITVSPVSPRNTYMFALENDLISRLEFEIFVAMLEDRNLTSHTYHEDLAQQVSERIPRYYILMSDVAKRLE